MVISVRNVEYIEKKDEKGKAMPRWISIGKLIKKNVGWHMLLVGTGTTIT